MGLIHPKFWSDRRVFLTGHTGFKGSWLSLWLSSLGANVTGFSLKPPTHPNLFELANIEQSTNSILGDIRDLALLRDAINSAKPEIVIHMAAQPLVLTSYEDPLDTYQTNIMGTAYLLESLRNCPSIKAVLIITSDKCYENREWLWGYREIDAMGGYDPYSSSKGCAELVTAAYRQSYFNPYKYADHGVAIASARAGNIIGGGDWASNRLIPDAMRAFLADETLVVRNGDAIRPWQHILDPLHGYIVLSQKLLSNAGNEYSEAWNFGPKSENEIRVSEIVKKLTKIWGRSANWVDTNKNAKLHEANYLRLDCTKSVHKLDWQPKISITRALQLTVEWYQAYQKNEDMRLVTLNQINNFMY